MATTDCDALAAQLKEAREAYHALRIGNKPYRVTDSNGESVSFTTANATSLAAYIRDLENQLQACLAGSTGCVGAARGPLRPTFL